MSQFEKKEIARLQLQTAVEMFLSGLDRSSVITLAGAASGILDPLVRRTGGEPFVDYARKVHRELRGFMPGRESYSHYIDKKLGVVAHKHLGKGDSETIELDLEKSAFDALARALSDYVCLYGKDEAFVKAFFNWAWKTKDGSTIMTEFKNAPKKLRPK
jgi:hypothetical protein